MNSRALAAVLTAAVALGGAAPLAAQATGALAGAVHDAATGHGIGGAIITVGDGRRGAVTDPSGAYRVRELRSGTYNVQIRAIGYGPVARGGVTIRGGETTSFDVTLEPRATELAPLEVTAPTDPLLDPLATRTEQVITAEDLRTLPVSSLEEALTLAPGATGESYRGGRLGEQAFIVDGLGVKNQLDASTGTLGLRLPPDLLTEASLVTNGFSARYGQALSGLVNVVTKDGGPTWAGRLAYETDRPLSGPADLGLDRVVAEADGPVIGGATAVVSLDATGRLDADPVSAPAPTDAGDPRAGAPIPLPHNGGQQVSAGGKLTIPFGRQTLRIFGLRSIEDRLLYDQAYKYDAAFAAGRRTAGTLGSVQLQHASAPGARMPIVLDLRLGYYGRDFVRGAPAAEPDRFFGAFSTHPLHIVGEELAATQDTATARAALPGFGAPTLSSATPWGVPAFFVTGASRGDLTWSRYREVRGQLDVTVGTGSRGDLYIGGEISRQTVRTFQRTLAYLPVGDTVPPATASYFTPLALAVYAEEQVRMGDVAVTAGLRFDRFDARADLPGRAGGAKQQLNPRIGVSTVLKGATVVMSGGSFSQPPDYQYLVDAAFDDTARTGRFRRGNPNLGFERSWQWEMSVRGRLRPGLALRAGAYVKRLQGLVASIPLGLSPDSSIFGNNDAGTVRGLELRMDREIQNGWGARVYYTLQEANATSTSAFVLRRAPQIDPASGETLFPAQVEIPLDYDRRHTVTVILQGRANDAVGPRLLGVRPLAGLEVAAIGRISSGLPFTKLPEADTLLATPNGARLPGTSTVDLLLRRPLRLAGLRGGIYLDVRNLLNRRNIVAVRRDTGLPTASNATIGGLAEQAYAAHPETIPYESPRYRAAADVDHNGLIEGRDELFPLYLAAARDYTQPIFAYGTPRLWRFGVEVVF